MDMRNAWWNHKGAWETLWSLLAPIFSRSPRILDLVEAIKVLVHSLIKNKNIK